MKKHIDLFSGIGGFAYAIDQVWEGVEHTFVELDPFCQAVLKKHWPESTIHGDIKTFTNTTSEGSYFLLTGGFPCQPFSQAGRRQGTADDRPNGDALHCGDKCGIIGLCNGDTTTSVQDAGRTHDEKLGEDIANPVRPSTKRSGEQGTSNGGGQTIGSGVSNGSTRYTNDMEGNASVVEKRTMPSSPSTTSTEGGTRSEDNTTARHGNSSSRTDTPRHTKSSASTATTQNTISEPAPTNNEGVFLLTGGFPCQPFSQAGRRKGTNDERYLWPEMFRVIREFKPTWVIAENVSGLVSWSEGLVLEQVCTDLESEGYEVQPFIIPAVAVNAPHRRDRVWIVANRTESGWSGDRVQGTGRSGFSSGDGEDKKQDNHVEDTNIKRSGGRMEGDRQILGSKRSEIKNARSSWQKNWIEVATELCSVDDGLPVELGEPKLSKAGHRREQLKAYGNAIVPQVAYEILRNIEL